MEIALRKLFEQQGGVATSAQILAVVSRYEFESVLKARHLERVWHGIYCLGEPTDELRLRGLDLSCGSTVSVCLSTAAALFGFDTENPPELHVLNPAGRQLRPVDGLVVHRRDGAPLVEADGRLATAPAWTAIEVARALRRPRALATLDAALRSKTCTRGELWRTVIQHAGRRGIVAVRDLLALADSRAESPMESEVRLAMIDGGLPMPELQYEIIDGNGELRRLDFAWPEFRLAVEYDGIDWHTDPNALRSDRRRRLALQDIDWTVIAIVQDDVRHRAFDFVSRVERQMRDARAA
ncbi:hypothetical protein, partial [Mycobacterium sp. E740]|uniref:hypothetical protein n=1 Tax=Mycobacterium sp. E740 TaxID=1834149 RepID=UPI0007FE8DB1